MEMMLKNFLKPTSLFGVILLMTFNQHDLVFSAFVKLARIFQKHLDLTMSLCK